MYQSVGHIISAMKPASFWILAAILAVAAAYTERNIVCYFSNWAPYREGNGKMDIDDINPHLCTHLVYEFIGLNSNGSIQVIDRWSDLGGSETGGGHDGFRKFNRLRANSSVKTLIAIGGWGAGSEHFSKVVADPVTRDAFAENIVEFINKYDFDGLDLFWTYPNQDGGAEADKRNYILLLKKLKKLFVEEEFVLSASVIAFEDSAKQSYIISEITEHLDLINLISWDLHGPWENKTGINSPTYVGSWEKGWERLLNVNHTVRYWLSQGAHAEKLNLAIPTFGHTYTLDDPNNNGIGAPAHSPGRPGPYTADKGSLGYNEICEVQLEGGWTVKFQEEQRVPYAFKGDQWVGYDNPESVKEKGELINALGLGGVMVWSLERDDFRGICGEKFPLLTTLNRVLRDHPETSTRTTTTTTTEDNNNLVICYTPGYVRDPYDCAVYYMCIPDSREEFRKIKSKCPDGYVFDTTLMICNTPDYVTCVM